MSRRLDVELTSSRPDGSWTWRAAGARQPKGELDGSLLYEGAKVGDVVRADADFTIEGIAIIAVLPPKGSRREPDRLEIIGPARRDEPGVTTVLAPKGRRERRDGRDGGEGRDSRGPRDGRDNRGDRRPRDDRHGGRPGGPGSGTGGPGGARSGAGAGGGGSQGRGRRPDGGERRDPRTRAPRPAPEAKPKAKRLRAGRAHRQAALAALPETYRPIAEELMRGGIPGVRQAVDRQNALLKADDKPIINPDPLMDIAERLMPLLRSAEWHDKAEAALADATDIDIRDLRSVVVAADVGARDDETRALADQLRAALAERVDHEHHTWLAEISQNLDDSRVVRALRLSSRPPKAGAPFPADLAKRLADATGVSLTADITADRFATVLDALALSPVRQLVTPVAIPAKPSDELLAAVRKLASRLPAIAALFGIEPSNRPSKGGPKAAKAPQVPAPPVPPPPAAETPRVETPAVETPAVETPAVESPVVESPVVESPVVETPAVETLMVETPAAEPSSSASGPAS